MARVVVAAVDGEIGGRSGAPAEKEEEEEKKDVVLFVVHGQYPLVDPLTSERQGGLSPIRQGIRRVSPARAREVDSSTRPGSVRTARRNTLRDRRLLISARETPRRARSPFRVLVTRIFGRTVRSSPRSGVSRRGPRDRFARAPAPVAPACTYSLSLYLPLPLFLSFSSSLSLALSLFPSASQSFSISSRSPLPHQMC